MARHDLNALERRLVLHFFRCGSKAVNLLVIARAVACPSRLLVLQLLGEDGLCLSEAARQAGIAVSTAHHHLAVLIDAGLARKGRSAGRAVYRWSRTRCSIALSSAPTDR